MYSNHQRVAVYNIYIYFGSEYTLTKRKLRPSSRSDYGLEYISSHVCTLRKFLSMELMVGVVAIGVS